MICKTPYHRAIVMGDGGVSNHRYPACTGWHNLGVSPETALHIRLISSTRQVLSRSHLPSLASADRMIMTDSLSPSIVEDLVNPPTHFISNIFVFFLHLSLPSLSMHLTRHNSAPWG